MEFSKAQQLSIALFWPTFGEGGVERTGLRVAQELVRRGYPTEIVVVRAVGPLAREVPGDIPVVDLGARLGQGQILSAVFPLARYLRRSQPQVLWSHMTEANVIAVMAKLLAGYRGWHIVSEHSTLSARIRRRRRKQLLPLLVRLGYRFADRVHAVSHGVADDLAQVGGIPRGKIAVVYNPVPISDILSQAEELVDHPWFAPGEPPVVLGVGRLTWQKDFATLIRAFKRVRSRLPARLLILGEGSERPRLESLVRELGLENDVALPGYVLNPFKFMQRADVFVLSSVLEGLPVVLIEAMAAGTPVIATDCPHGPAELLEYGRWGELVPPGNDEALAEAIVRALQAPDPERVRKAQERAREFAVERIVDRYVHELFPG